MPPELEKAPKNPAEASEQESRYGELYALSKELFAEEQSRVAAIESKAAKYFPAILFLAGGFGFFAQEVLRMVSERQGFLQVVTAVLVVVEFLIMVFSALLLLSIMSQRRYATRVVDVDFFDRNELPSIYRTLAMKNREAIERNRCENDKKAVRLLWSHRLLIAALLVLFGIVGTYAMASVIR